MEKNFRPDMRVVTYTLMPTVGSEIKVTPGVYDPKQNVYKPTGGLSYAATVIGVGDTYASVCLSRNEKSCLQCFFPPRFCKAPIE